MSLIKIRFFFAFFIVICSKMCGAQDFFESDIHCLVLDKQGSVTTEGSLSDEQKDEKNIPLRCFYSCDPQGFLKEFVIDDGKEEDSQDLTGVTHRQIVCLKVGEEAPLIGKPLKIETYYWESNCSEEILYEMHFHYDEEGELVSIVDNQGEKVVKVNSLVFPSQFSELLCSSEKGILNVENFVQYIPVSQIWDHIVDSFFSSFQYLQLSAHQAKRRWSAELKFPAPIAHTLEKIGKIVLGQGTYLLLGNHFEETEVNCYGGHEISDKVRVTFINGILNTRNAMLQSLDIISESHGGTKVHYVFRPTEGWTWDISRAIMIRTAFLFGFRSLHACLLAQMWKELIQEMGGIGGGGSIVHYAHSLGGSETDRARELLSPEEQKMIRIVTFGSATLVRNTGFQSVVNVISLNDGVTLLEPFGHIRNYFDPNTNLIFKGNLFFKNYSWPLCDHLLNGPTYGPILHELGKKFLEEFKK